jgi:ribosome maturation factor RimP
VEVAKESEFVGALTPLVAAAGLDLYDLEVGRGLVKVTVNRPGGVDLDTLAELNSTLSHFLDEHDPMPGHYALEVSSPGLERPLRVPAHFRGAIGESVTLRVVRADAPAQRVAGTLVAADDEGIELAAEEGRVTARYTEIERARTTFSWGATKAPSPSKAKPKPRTNAAATREG